MRNVRFRLGGGPELLLCRAVRRRCVDVSLTEEIIHQSNGCKSVALNFDP